MARSKDVVFSSEKIESRERLKRILIPVIALLVILAIAAGAAFAVRALRGEVFTGGADTAYPYNWRISNGGVMTLEIDHSADPGRTWTAINSDMSRMHLETPDKQPKDRSRFLFTPVEEGRYTAYFFLVDENNESAGKLEMLMETEADAKGVLRTTVLSSSLQARQAQTSGGEDTFYPYSYATDSDGYLVVTVTGGAVAGDWSCVSDNEAVASEAGLFYEEEDIILYLMAGSEPGSCNVKLSSEEGAVAINFLLIRDEGGALLVRSDSIEGGDTLPVTESTEEL